MSDQETVVTEKRQRVPKKDAKSVEPTKERQEESEAEVVGENDEAKETESKAKKKNPAAKRIAASTRAGLVFTVARSRPPLKLHAEAVGKTAPVFMAAVAEYLLAEIIDLSSIAMKERNKDSKRLMSHHIQAGLNGDEELHTLFSRMYGEDFNLEDIEEQKQSKVKRAVDKELHFKKSIPKELRAEISGDGEKKKQKKPKKAKEPKEIKGKVKPEVELAKIKKEGEPKKSKKEEKLREESAPKKKSKKNSEKEEKKKEKKKKPKEKTKVEKEPTKKKGENSKKEEQQKKRKTDTEEKGSKKAKSSGKK